MSDNPFEAPKSTVSDMQVDNEVGALLDEPRKNPAGFGWKWIKEGFELFKLSPLIWVGMTVVYLLLNIIPFVSMVAAILVPVFMSGWIYGAHELDQGRALKVSHLFKGFTKNIGSLLGVAGLYILGIIVSIVAAMGVAALTGGLDMFTRVATQDGAGGLSAISGLILPGLVYLALLIPIMMMIWFAPALVILNDMGAVEAMKRSFSGCIKNILPFLLYGVIAMVLVILGMIPLFLGLLVVIPVLTAAIYTSYKDIFLY